MIMLFAITPSAAVSFSPYAGAMLFTLLLRHCCYAAAVFSRHAADTKMPYAATPFFALRRLICRFLPLRYDTPMLFSIISLILLFYAALRCFSMPRRHYDFMLFR